jgi:hypothetical protein
MGTGGEAMGVLKRKERGEQGRAPDFYRGLSEEGHIG